MTQTTIDAATFAALEATTGKDFVQELVAAFLDEAPRMLATLRTARGAGDVDLFRRSAHSLKSNSNTFGALHLGVLARELELGAAQAVKSPDTAALDVLDAEYARVAAALQEPRHG